MTDQEIIDISTVKAIKSLEFLSRRIVGYKDINKQTHGEIINLLEDSNKRKMIVVPRGSLKSSIACVAYPIWLLIRNPNLRILIDSEIYTNSKNFIREIKAHLESEVMTTLFGDFKGPTWSEGEIIIRQRTKSSPQASITAGGVETQKTGQHYDVIIMDDLNSPTNSNTQDGCEKVINHFRYNNSILDPNGIMVVIGTRYAANDLIGFILDTQKHNYKKAG